MRKNKSYRLISLALLALLVFARFPLCAQTGVRLSLEPEDAYIEKIDAFVYDIYIRARGDIKSVMLIAAPDRLIGANENALRLDRYDTVNGDEKAMGVKTGYTIIDSTPEAHSVLGVAYRLRLRTTVLTGEGGNRRIHFREGAAIYLRAYAAKEGDETAPFRDRAFVLQPNTAKTFSPSLTLDYFEKAGDTYALYIVFSGGDSREQKWYFYDSLVDTQYRRLTDIFTWNADDAAMILLNETYSPVHGKRIRAKAFFKAAREDREVRLNLFDESGNAQTPPITFFIPGQGASVKTNRESSPAEGAPAS